MKFKVIYSERALSDLRNIHRYIAVDLLMPEVAQKTCDNIMAKIESLDELPNRCSLYEKEPWHSRGLRKLFIDNYIAFYLPMEKQGQVLVVTIMYGKRDIAKIMDDLVR